MICTFIWYLEMNLRIPLHDKKNLYKLYSPVFYNNFIHFYILNPFVI